MKNLGMKHMINQQDYWFQLNTEQRRKEIQQRRFKGESFAKIASDLLGDPKKKSTIWSWAQRNMETQEIYPKMKGLPHEPFSRFSEIEQWVMYDILSSLYPRLDAMSEHILVEVQKIHTEQREKFSTTAGFLDELENRVIEAIRRNSAILTTNVSRAVTSAVPPRPPSIPRVSRVRGVQTPPPPPPGSALSSQTVVGSGSITELRTDFEEMTMEEITALPSDFLEALTPTDRNRLQERVKELKRIEKMSSEEREAYLQKKTEEKERAEAAEGLGVSLVTMLDDSDSLYARMRRAADESQVSGTGTFGKFTTDFNYIYCFACGKMNRVEEETLTTCEFCGAGEDLLVLDEEKSSYSYWECLSSKALEPVDLDYSRGKQIVVKSRWKIPIDEQFNSHDCKTENVREITSAVLVKADPDIQFSHYITLFRMYMQLKLPGDLRSYLDELSIEIQKLPDIISKEDAVSQAFSIMKKVLFLLNWLGNRGVIETVDSSGVLQIQVNNIFEDIKLLQNPDSPQDLTKASEIGHITGKLDQLLNRFSTIFVQLEPELLIPSKWKCSECNNIFEVKNRHKFPESCVSCGKIITKLEAVE